MLPDGDHGTEIMPDFAYSTTIAEEWHVVPLQQTAGFFAVFRTSTGLLGSTRTADATAASHWQNSTFASFDMQPLPGSAPEVPISWAAGWATLISFPHKYPSAPLKIHQADAPPYLYHRHR